MTPKLVDVDFDAVEVSAGNSHCAAVDNKGRVYTWGTNGGVMNGGGQLGHGPSYDQVFLPRSFYFSSILTITKTRKSPRWNRNSISLLW